MDEPKYHLLFIDDEPDLLLIAESYLRTQNIRVETTQSGQDALSRLTSSSYDAIVSDYEMPGMDGLTLLKEVRNRGIEIPFILFTGRGREEVVIQAIELGVDYYVQKGIDFVSQFTELLHKIERSIERRKLNQIKHEMEERFRLAFEGATDAIFWADAETGILVNCNAAAERLVERNREEIIGKHHSILHPPEVIKPVGDLFQKQVSTSGYAPDEVLILTKSGKEIPVRIFNTITHIGSQKIIRGIFFDRTKEVQDQKELELSESRFLSLFNSIPMPTWLIDFSLVKRYFNELRKSGITSIRDFLHEHPEKIRYCFSLIKFIHLNTAALQLFPVHNKEEAIQCVIALFTDESWLVFGEELIALDEGKTVFEATSPVCDPQGNIQSISFRVTVNEGDIETLSRVYVSYQNIAQ